MIEKNDEKFYKEICEKYIKTMSKEMLLEMNNKILHIFVEDEYIELKEKGQINNQNYKEYLDGDFEIYEYDSYKELYDSTIKDEIIYDVKDLGLFNDDGKWDFYITFEELKRMGYANEVQYNYPLLEKYIIEDEDNFYNCFSLEQLDEFEKSLHLYYETDDMDIDKYEGLYSKSNTPFDNNIIALSEGIINYYDFIEDYKVDFQTQYDLFLDTVIDYFKENDIKDLMDYGSDRDEGLTSLSSLYKELMDKLKIKYEDIYTEDVSDGKYLTTIIFKDNSEIEIDTSAWNGIKTITENIESIYETYEKLQENNKEIDYNYE